MPEVLCKGLGAGRELEQPRRLFASAVARVYVGAWMERHLVPCVSYLITSEPEQEHATCRAAPAVSMDNAGKPRGAGHVLRIAATCMIDRNGPRKKMSLLRGPCRGGAGV